LSVKLGTSKNNHKIDAVYEARIANEIVQGLESKTVKMLYWSGGEPMIMKLHWIVIEKMLELLELPEYHDYIKSIEICYNTNLSKLYYKNHYIPEVLGKLNVLIWASLDGVEETHNYCRDGSDWRKVHANWKEYKKHIANIGITSVLSAPVLMDIEKYIDFLKTEGCMFFDHEFLPTGYNKLLDIKMYPDDIFFKVIKNARDKLISSGLDSQSVHNSITILNKYIAERSDDIPDYSSIKRDIENRDVFNKGDMSFETLLHTLDSDCYIWYSSI
jgi:sulfatase maturation enzyme AslB (radical SAM superfamily)